MTRTPSFIMASLALAASAGAYAQDMRGLSVAPFVAQVDSSPRGFSGAKSTLTGVRLNWLVKPNLALEAQLAGGTSGGTAESATQTADIAIKQVFGLYGKAMLPVSATMSVYGLLGYSRLRMDIAVQPQPLITAYDGDVSFGVGMELVSSENTRISVDWIRLAEGIKRGDIRVDALTAALSFLF